MPRFSKKPSKTPRKSTGKNILLVGFATTKYYLIRVTQAQNNLKKEQ